MLGIPGLGVAAGPPKLEIPGTTPATPANKLWREMHIGGLPHGVTSQQLQVLFHLFSFVVGFLAVLVSTVCCNRKFIEYISHVGKQFVAYVTHGGLSSCAEEAQVFHVTFNFRRLSQGKQAHKRVRISLVAGFCSSSQSAVFSQPGSCGRCRCIANAQRKRSTKYHGIFSHCCPD